MKKPNDDQRAFDAGENIDDFSREILVVCPKCGSQAQIKPVEAYDANLFAARRLICPQCACVRKWN